MHPGNSKNKRLLLDPCHLTFRFITVDLEHRMYLNKCHSKVIVSAFVLHFAFLKKSTEKACVQWKAFTFKMAGAHSSLERSVMARLGQTVCLYN